MNPALRILEEWTTHQDYLWFLALVAWGGVLGAELRRKDAGWTSGGQGWLIALAASGLAGALLELVLLGQHLQMPYTKLDLAMGAAQAVGTGALVWGATAGTVARRSWRMAAGIVLGALGVARDTWPVEAGLALALIQVGAVLRLVTVAPELVSRPAGAFLALMPFIATHGPWAYAVREGRRMADWSHFALFAAGVSLAAGAVLALAAWRRRLVQATGGGAISVDLRRDLRRALITLVLWLAGGVLLAVWYGRGARQAFEENFLRRMDTAVLALDSDAVAEALGPELRIASIEQKRYRNGRPVAVATVPHTRAPVYTALRTQMARVREHNPDFKFLYIATWRAGQLLVLNSLPRKDEGITHVIHHEFTDADLDRLAAGRSFLEGPVISEGWLPQFSAKAALRHPQTRQLLGWLVADVEATHWMTTFRQARLQTMALVGAGVGLWALAVAYRIRREARDAAEQRAAAAAAADRMKSAFLAKVSHELRTPIQSILGFGELLEAAPLAEVHRGWLAALRSHGDIMLRLVNDLIDLGALQSGAFRLEPRPVGLRPLVEECVAALRPAASAKGLLLQTEFSPDLPLWVRVDGVRLRQILLNLLNNAVKFTPVGRIAFLVRPHSDGSIEFVVADTGPGIPPGLRPRLFQPFARLDPAAGGGSGLGLALVQGLCGVMGGSVHLADSVGEGATFVVRLPLVRCEAPVAAAAGGDEAPGASPSLAGLRVLVAEDNTLVRELLVAFLTENGADVIVAVDGATALALAREGVADVMLLDIGLPQLDGLAVAETLRAEGLRALRIIGLSAHVSAADEARARRAGMDAFLGKPVRLATLAAVITQQVSAPQAAGAAPEGIPDSALRQKLMAQFAAETPALIVELRAALAAGDWARLRHRAHYLKNSADVLGLLALQDACARLSGLELPPDPAAAKRGVEAIEAAIPSRLVASPDSAPVARI
jgi:signal transduction histidine kinase/CheY-like chemotaxis protein